MSYEEWVAFRESLRGDMKKAFHMPTTKTTKLTIPGYKKEEWTVKNDATGVSGGTIDYIDGSHKEYEEMKSRFNDGVVVIAKKETTYLKPKK